jgi:hypothetical protein
VGWNAALLVMIYDGPAHSGIVVYERSVAESGLCRLFASIRERLGLEDAAIETLLSGGNITNDHAEPTGPQSVPPALVSEAQACLAEYLDTLVPEVQRSLSYVTHRYQGWSFADLLVTGDGADLAVGHKLREKLAAALGPHIRVAPIGPALPVSFLAAAGASLHGLDALGCMPHRATPQRRAAA